MRISQISGLICLTLVLLLGFKLLENEFHYATAQDANQTGVTPNKTTNAGNQNKTADSSNANKTDYISLIAPVSAAAITGVGTYLATVKQKNKESQLQVDKAKSDKELEVQKAKSDKDLEWHKKITELMVQYDTDLRNKRIEAYKGLWMELKPIEFFSLRRNLTTEGVEEVATKLKNWYYDVGGLFMTNDSNSKYLDFNTSVFQITKDVISADRPKPLPDAAQDQIRSKAESIRESLINDVGTRAKLILESSTDSAPRPTALSIIAK
jgi:hypothetical protein